MRSKFLFAAFVLLSCGACSQEPRIERRGTLAAEFTAEATEQQISAFAHHAALVGASDGLRAASDSDTEEAVKNSSGAPVLISYLVSPHGSQSDLVAFIGSPTGAGLVVQVYAGGIPADRLGKLYAQLRLAGSSLPGFKETRAFAQDP